MVETITPMQMRELEADAISSGLTTGRDLMERAGAGVVDAILAKWPTKADAPRRAVVLCGPGNNGGDGFVVARLLLEKGWSVVVGFYGDAAKLPPDARENHDRWAELGPVVPFPPQDTYEPFLAGFEPGALLIDALFGIGLTRPIAFDLCTAVLGLAINNFANDWNIVAVDVPSGLDAETGTLLCGPPPHPGVATAADLTVTFHAPKTGHKQNEGPAVCGELVVADIGLGPAA